MTDYVDLEIARWVPGREVLMESILDELDGFTTVVAEPGGRVVTYTLTHVEEGRCLAISREAIGGLREAPPGPAAVDRAT